jgi:ABC-type multidrug transport system fused ATPase/permease subunit
MFDLVVLVTALGLVLTTPGMTAAKAGFIIGFAVNITNEFNTFVVCAREWDLKGVTLERLSEYRTLDTEQLPSFVDDNQDMSSPSDEWLGHESWPASGKIEVDGLRARYAPDLPDVLSGVTFKVESGQRIGIVGATGCGKSTLAKAFFSFVDISAGTIRVDDRGKQQ